LISFSRQYSWYVSVALVFEKVRTLDGIAPALFVRKDVFPMWCSDGLLPELYFFVASNFAIEWLYGRSTHRLSANGRSFRDIHQTCVNESVTRIRSMFTHWAGPGRRAGLWQTNSCIRFRLPRCLNRRSASTASVDIVGLRSRHPFPISRTIEPAGVSSFASSGASALSHSTYASPSRFPYAFFLLSGNGGEVKIRFTFPTSRSAFFDARKSSHLVQ